MKTLQRLLAVGFLTFGLLAVPLIEGGYAKKPQVKQDTRPGPAYRMVEGKLIKIKGRYYVVREYTGNKVRVYVSKKTKMLRGRKKPGDSIRVEITQGRFANSIQ